MVPGIGPSPDKMLLGRLFSYPDTHRYRIGPNYLHLPINQPKSPVHSYNKDGAMAYTSAPDPVYAPNSFNGPRADSSLDEGSFGDVTGEIVRAAYSKHREDDDFIQPGTMYRNVLDEDARARLVSNIAGHATNGVTPDMQVRVIEYWRQVDGDLGARVAKAIESAS
jgi:catalase